MKFEVIYTEQVTYKEIIEISQEEEEKAIKQLREWYDELLEEGNKNLGLFEDFVKEEIAHQLNLSQYYYFNDEDIIDSELTYSEEYLIE